MRESQAKLENLCLGGTAKDQDWMSAVEDTRWARVDLTEMPAFHTLDTTHYICHAIVSNLLEGLNKWHYRHRVPCVFFFPMVCPAPFDRPQVVVPRPERTFGSVDGGIQSPRTEDPRVGALQPRLGQNLSGGWLGGWATC